MTNNEIAKIFETTSKLLELHGTNPFKLKAIQNAVYIIENMSDSIQDLDNEELINIEGLGKSAIEKIREILSSGTTTELQDLIDQTPSGVIEMFKISGIGPKKIKTLWQELSITTLEELKEACLSNKIAQAKGFGTKTQDKILSSLEFLLENKGKLLFADAESTLSPIIKFISTIKSIEKFKIVGDYGRKLPIVNSFEILIQSSYSATTIEELKLSNLFGFKKELSSPFSLRGTETITQLPISFIICNSNNFIHYSILHTCSENFKKTILPSGKSFYQSIIKSKIIDSEEAIFQSLNIAYIPTIQREFSSILQKATQGVAPEMVPYSALKGILHNHSKWSDGKNTIEEMALGCIERGMTYFGISDHSKTASYAGGLQDYQVINQFKEIDLLNNKYPSFKIFKGIESDILNDGSLDYNEDILNQFDYIVSSIHSGLDMDIDKATSRLIKAIENPNTKILGHLTGRLLLRRKGYPVNHQKIIDACASNKVAIEINANPWRLDIDWTQLPYCIDKGVMISINPDAHEINGLDDMPYGLYMAQKAGVPQSLLLNALTKDEISEWFSNK